MNIFSGLVAYEILREKGVTEAEGIKAYDSMCAFIRKLSSVLYKGADLLPNGYKIVRQSLLDDLEGEKRMCWDIEILQDDDKGFTYKISRCLYFDTCKEHGYPEFCKVFCTHDWYAFGVLKHHSKFIRKSTIAEERKAKKYTQRVLADKLSISDKTISKWERGNGSPEGKKGTQEMPEDYTEISLVCVRQDGMHLGNI